MKSQARHSTSCSTIRGWHWQELDFYSSRSFLSLAMAEPIIIEIPRAPAAKNELRRIDRNPHAYKKYREQWQQDLWFSVRQPARAKLMNNKGKVRLLITIFPKRLWPDKMNLYQALVPVVDACVNIGYLPADDDKHLDLEVRQMKRQGARALTILEFELCQSDS